MKRSRRSFLKVMGSSAAIGAFPYAHSGNADENTIPYQQQIPIQETYDVIVCGGGPAGLTSALAARREGMRVLILESQGQLGGMSTSGLVSHWLGGRSSDCQTWVVGGLFKTLSLQAAELGFALIPNQEPDNRRSPHGWGRGQLTAGIPLDPYGLSWLLDQKMKQAGIDVLFHTNAIDVRIKNNHISHVIAFNKSGLLAFPARAIIDATGDADIAFRSGCDTIKGRKEDGLMTPVTLEFHVYNVNQQKFSDYIHEHKASRFLKEIKQWTEQGIWTFSYNRFITVQLIEEGTFMVNTPRLTGIDGTNGYSKSEGMIRGREEIFELLNIMRQHIPGFEDVKLKAIAPLLGVRETRRIQGDFTLKVSDLVHGKKFRDTIGYTAYGWDLPDPKSPSYQPMSEKNIKKPEFTPIPYGVMVPTPVKNLICPGRAVCVERHVLGPVRVMAPCMAMGEAAGTAAKQVVQNGISFKQVDTRQLRHTLEQHGAIVEI